MDIIDHFQHAFVLPPPHEPLILTDLPRCGAVYAFMDGEGRIIQLLSAQNLRKSVNFRLHAGEETSKRRADLRAVARSVEWTPAYSRFEAAWLYLRLSRELLPSPYRRQLAFGPVWFAHIDPGDEHPRWTPQKIAYRGGVDIGPFQTQKACVAFISQLEDLFELCRKHDILVQTPHGKACVYFEMGRCPAPCDGSIPWIVYRTMLQQSIRFACVDRQACGNLLREEMKSAAGNLQFERAARLKAALDELERGGDRIGTARLGNTAEEFRYGILQRGRTASRWHAFWMDRGRMEFLGEYTRKTISELARAWMDRAASSPEIATETPERRSEAVWLVSQFLAKGVNTPGFFLRGMDTMQVEEIKERVGERFHTDRVR